MLVLLSFIGFGPYLKTGLNLSISLLCFNVWNFRRNFRKRVLILDVANLSLGFCETGSVLILIFSDECMHVFKKILHTMKFGCNSEMATVSKNYSVCFNTLSKGKGYVLIMLNYTADKSFKCFKPITNLFICIV